MPTIPDLPAIAAVTDPLLVAVDDGLKTWRTSAGQLLQRTGVALTLTGPGSSLTLDLDGGFLLASAAGGSAGWDASSATFNIRFPAGQSFQVLADGAGGSVYLDDGSGTSIWITGGVIYTFGPIAINNHVDPTGLGTIVKAWPIFDYGTGALMGYVPIYDAV